MSLHRGDVVLAEYPHSAGGTSRRPVLVVQADLYNARLGNTIVAQITSTLERLGDACHLLIDISTADGMRSGLLRNSVVSCNNLHTIDQRRINRTIGRITEPLMQQIDACLKTALAIP